MAVSQLVQRHMEVVGCDGEHVGTVADLDGMDHITLAKDDPDAAGKEHCIPLAWLIHAEIKVHLKLPGDEAKARWTTH